MSVAFGGTAAESPTGEVHGVDPDLRIRPFFAHGETLSIREFIVGALNAEMGLQVADPDTAAAANGARVITPAGMVLDGATDNIEGTPGAGELDPVVVDYLEFYLLNYFKPGRGESTAETNRGRRLLRQIGCTRCHVPDLTVARDRRVADVETVSDPVRGHFKSALCDGLPAVQLVSRRPRQRRRQKLAVSRVEVILRHGGEAQAERDAFAAMPATRQQAIVALLNALVLFPPDDTASNLAPGDPSTPGFPQSGYGSIKLTVLFNDPRKIE